MNDSKRILLLDTGREWGGGTNSLLELLKRIDRGRFDITVLFYEDVRKGDGPSIGTVVGSLGFPFLLKERRGIPGWAKAVKEVARVAVGWSRPLRARAVFAVDFRWRIRPDADVIARILREGRFDLLYLNNQPSTNLEGILAAYDAGVPSLQHSRIETELNASEVNAVNRMLTRMICVSDGVKETFVSQGVHGEKCTVIYNGIDGGSRPAIPPSKIRREWDIPGDHILLGTVGSLVRRKRVDDFLMILAMVSAGGSRSVSGMVVGDGPEKYRLAAKARRMGVDGICRFTGFQAEALSYINAMDIFVFPTEREGFPRVLLEAMLMGKPVVASRVAGSEQLVLDGETGFLIPVGRTEGFASAVDRLVADPDLRGRMGGNGLRRVLSDYSIEKYVQGVERILREMLPQ
jgi:glycosyltransferase involved in cell wall biosynthesis